MVFLAKKKKAKKDLEEKEDEDIFDKDDFADYDKEDDYSEFLKSYHGDDDDEVEEHESWTEESAEWADE